MSIQPLMPKATAVWLVENTSLSFDQIGEFCGLHALECQLKGRKRSVMALLAQDAHKGIKQGQDERIAGRLGQR